MKSNARFILLIALILGSGLFLRAQELNKKITDPKADREILFGYCNRAGLEEGEFGRAFKEYYSIYEPDEQALADLKSRLDSVTILIVLGTWCSDSEEQVPKFFKVLDKIRFRGKHLTLVCVDRDKQAGEIDLKKYDIQRVPTFIIFRGDREIGRIIETPMTSLEKDLLLILSE